MKKIILTLTTILALMFPATALADGNSLLEKCLAGERYDNTGDWGSNEILSAYNTGVCHGLAQGVHSTMEVIGRLSPDSNLACFPEDGITNGQAVHIILLYLKQHPNKLHRHEVTLAMLALADAFPCEKKRK